MKKIITLLLILLCVAGCATQSTDPKMDEYFENWTKNYQFKDNTAATLINKKKSNYTIMMVANSDLALISMKKDNYSIDRYLCGKTEYFYVNTESVKNKYFKVNVNEAAFTNPKDLYTQMVLNTANLKNFVFVNTETVDNIECDVVEAKLDKNIITLYYNHVNGDLYKMQYKGGNSLIFSDYELSLPSQFDKAQSTDVETINTYIQEFQGK